MSLKTRLWVLAAGVVCAVVLLLGVFGGVLPQLTDASSTSHLAEEAEERNELLRLQIEQARQQQDRTDELGEQLEELRAAIPPTAASAAWLRELTSIEQASGATVRSFEVSTPASVAPATDTAEGTSDGSGQSAPAQLLAVPMLLTVDGNETQVADFIRLLQTGERLISVYTVSLSGSGEVSQASLTGQMYVAPM